MFSTEDGHFMIWVPIKTPELQLLLDRPLPMSSHVPLKFICNNSFKQCYHNIPKSEWKVIQCFVGKKMKETPKHERINATQHEAGNTAALNA